MAVRGASYAMLWGAALALAVTAPACFTGSYLVGVPCDVDEECGPALLCEDGVCGGREIVPDLPPETEHDPPAARDDAYVIAMGDALAVAADEPNALLVNDDEGLGPLSVAAAQFMTSYESAVSISSAGDLEYTPRAEFWGCEAFPYVVSDAGGSSAEATVRVTVTPRDVGLAQLEAYRHGWTREGDAQALELGARVSAAGDMNGDGLADYVVSALDTDYDPPRARLYVVLGRDDGTASSFEQIAADGVLEGDGGFLILSEPGAAGSAFEVSPLGDLDGDGRDDIVIGAPMAKGSSAETGRVYVVFGKVDTKPVDLLDVSREFAPQEPGEGGFAIDGFWFQSRTGASVAGAGDVNGDGVPDIVIGAPDFGGGDHGQAYVVFARNGRFRFSLETLVEDGRGITIVGPMDAGASDPENTSDFGAAVAGVGDFNGDGLDDVVIGAPQSVGGGRAYIVFGGDAARTISVDTMTADDGVRMDSDGAPVVGVAVAGPGDVNGDGLGDALVGAPAPDTRGGAYVVLGAEDSGPLVALGSLQENNQGFHIIGEQDGDGAGASLAMLPDLTGDGLVEMLVGAPGAGDDAGRVYIVYGTTSHSRIELADVRAGQGGFALTGQGADHRAGTGIASAGDVDGDGRAELLIGAPETGVPGSRGRVHLLWTDPCRVVGGP